LHLWRPPVKLLLLSMRTCEQINIAAAAHDVWPCLADPQWHAEWNPKVVRVERSDSGPVRRGERFRMAYRLSREGKLHDVEVTEFDPPRRITYLHRISSKGVQQRATESYEIVPRDGGVEVRMEIDMTLNDVAWGWRALIWFINRFGKPTGDSPLLKLKQLVEPAPNA
jgi:uncharacterized protein YndB with AHSA1/START domain